MLGGVVARRGFALVPLQRRWVRDALGMDEEKLMGEMWVLIPGGRAIGGAEAYVYLSGFVWWAKPVAWAGRVPMLMRLMDRFYRWVAVNRHCISGACGLRRGRGRRTPGMLRWMNGFEG